MRNALPAVVLYLFVGAPLWVGLACSHRSPPPDAPESRPGDRAADKLEQTAHDVGQGATKAARATGSAVDGAVSAAGSVVERAGQRLEGR